MRETVESGWFAGAHRATSVAVPKARVSVRFAMRSKLKPTQKAAIRVTVRTRYAKPTGALWVYDGKRRIKTRVLRASAGGTVTFQLPRLKRKGLHRIKVVYRGDSRFAAATSAVRVVRVR